MQSFSALVAAVREITICDRSSVGLVRLLRRDTDQDISRATPVELFEDGHSNEDCALTGQVAIAIAVLERMARDVQMSPCTNCRSA